MLVRVERVFLLDCFQGKNTIQNSAYNKMQNPKTSKKIFFLKGFCPKALDLGLTLVSSGEKGKITTLNT